VLNDDAKRSNVKLSSIGADSVKLTVSTAVVLVDVGDAVIVVVAATEDVAGADIILLETARGAELLVGVEAVLGRVIVCPLEGEDWRAAVLADEDVAAR
jgi:hypothetical protein